MHHNPRVLFVSVLLAAAPLVSVAPLADEGLPCPVHRDFTAALAARSVVAPESFTAVFERRDRGWAFRFGGAALGAERPRPAALQRRVAQLQVAALRRPRAPPRRSARAATRTPGTVGVCVAPGTGGGAAGGGAAIGGGTSGTGGGTPACGTCPTGQTCWGGACQLIACDPVRGCPSPLSCVNNSCQ